MNIEEQIATKEEHYLNGQYQVHDVRYPLSRFRAEALGEREWDENDKWFTGIYPNGLKDRGPERDFTMKQFLKEYIESLPLFDGWENYNHTWDVLWYGTERFKTSYVDDKKNRHGITMHRWTVAHHDLPRQIIHPLQLISKEIKVSWTSRGVKKEEHIYFETREMKEIAAKQLPAYPDKDHYIKQIEERLRLLNDQAKRNR